MRPLHERRIATHPIIKLLAELRHRKGESLDSLSDRTGYHRATIGGWLNGDAKTPLDVIDDLLKAYGKRLTVEEIPEGER